MCFSIFGNSIKWINNLTDVQVQRCPEKRETIISSDQMEQRLLEATQKGNIHALKDLIGSNELILEEMALKEAGHTLLHVACLGGHLDVVQELLKHTPKFAEKVDRDGFSPLHIAAARGDVAIAEELLKVGTHLCSVEGWERRIPLHYAVIHGEVHVMEILLSTSPESVEEKTARKETALHLAAKNNRFKVLVRLVEHLKQHKKEQLINWKDHEGNTALHIAAASKNFEVDNFLLHGHALEYEVVEVNDLNESGLTLLDVSTPSQREAPNREITKILARVGANTNQSSKSDDYGWIYEALLVVAGLIANATYQSVLQPPTVIARDRADNNSEESKGLSAPAPSPGTKEKITYGAGLVYILFLGGNTFGFLVSVQMIIYLTKICLTKISPKISSPRFRYLMGLIMLSLMAMVLTYFCFTLSLLITSTRGAATATVLHVLPLMIAVFLLLIQKGLVKVLEFSWDSFSIKELQQSVQK